MRYGEPILGIGAPYWHFRRFLRSCQGWLTTCCVLDNHAKSAMLARIFVNKWLKNSLAFTYHFVFQLWVMPACSLHVMLCIRGKFGFGTDSVINAQTNRGILFQRELFYGFTFRDCVSFCDFFRYTIRGWWLVGFPLYHFLRFALYFSSFWRFALL